MNFLESQFYDDIKTMISRLIRQNVGMN